MSEKIAEKQDYGITHIARSDSDRDKESIFTEPLEQELHTNLHEGNSSVAEATFNMTKTIVGAGIFGLPLAYEKAGFITVTVLIVALAFIIQWTLTTLLRAGLRSNNYSYHHLMHHCFGKYGNLVYSLFAFLFAFGGMAAYTVIIGDTVPIVMRAMFGVAGTATADLSPAAKILSDRRVVIALASYLIMFPVSSFRDIHKLAKFSVVALVAIIIIAYLVCVGSLSVLPSEKGTLNVLSDGILSLTTFKSDGIYGAIGTLCFAYVCHHNTYIIFRSLKSPTEGNFNKVNTYRYFQT
jgi:solute carrier family 38 (sodium-coupled neutral amino acid transporter), member 11